MQPARKPIEDIEPAPAFSELWSRRDHFDDEIPGAMALPVEPEGAAEPIEVQRPITRVVVAPILSLSRRLRRLFS